MSFFLHPSRFALAALPLLLAACATSTDYRAPEIALPASFQHAGTQPTAAAIQPDWWAVYADAELDRLLRRVGEANAELAQAEARWRQALAQVDAARALALPQVGVGASATRSGGNAAAGANAGTRRLYAAGADLSWSPDLWGRVALSRQAATAGAQAQAALVDAARLALQLAAAQGYVRLRALDAQLALQAQADVAYARSLQVTQLQYEAGLVARADVIQAETQLQSLRTQVFTLQRQRALEANALALLAGSTPGDYPMAARDGGLPVVPAIPGALPGELLRRRPDLAAAERALAAAHARLGVAQRAWLPDLTLSASGTLQASSLVALAGRARAGVVAWPAARGHAVRWRRAPRQRGHVPRRRTTSRRRPGVAACSRLCAKPRTRWCGWPRWPSRTSQQQRLVDAGQRERARGGLPLRGGRDQLPGGGDRAEPGAVGAPRGASTCRAERLAASMALVAALGGGWPATAR
jgi:NodT family efflux transporter outer membrane factor (OMF) lipoprotein